MISEEKVALMTKAAIMEKNEREAFIVGKYFKKDYIVYHMLVVGACVLAALLMISAAIAVAFIENDPLHAQRFDWIGGAYLAAMVITIVLLVYIIITMAIYVRRYNNSMFIMKEYSTLLKKLDAYYDHNAPAKDAEEWVRYDEKQKKVRKIARRVRDND